MAAAAAAMTGPPEAAAIGDHVDVVAVNAVQAANGFRAPLADLAKATHNADGLVFVDGSQAVGAIRLDPGRDGFDMLAAASHKWLLGFRGSGYLFLKLPGSAFAR